MVIKSNISKLQKLKIIQCEPVETSQASSQSSGNGKTTEGSEKPEVSVGHSHWVTPVFSL